MTIPGAYPPQTTDIQDFYGDNLKLATAEQTNFTIDMKQQLVQDTSDSDATAAGRGAGGRTKAKKSSKAKRIAKAAAALSTVNETSQMDYHHHHHHQEVTLRCFKYAIHLLVGR